MYMSYKKYAYVVIDNYMLFNLEKTDMFVRTDLTGKLSKHISS